MTPVASPRPADEEFAVKVRSAGGQNFNEGYEDSEDDLYADSRLNQSLKMT